MAGPLRVLIVEDSAADIELLLGELRRGGYTPEYARVETVGELRAALTRQRWDVVLSDYGLPQFNGLEALQTLRETGLDIPMIIVSGSIGEELAVNLMKGGVNDYVMKGNLPRLVPAIERELRDASEREARRRAEAALRESEQRFRTLSEAALEGLVIHERGKIMEANRAFSELFGYPPSELAGLSVIKLVAPDSKEIVQRHLDEPTSEAYEVIGRRRDGSHFTAEVVARHLVYQHRPVRVTAVRDITARKQAELALAQAEKNYRMIVDYAPLGIYQSDRSGRILTTNLALARMLGYDSPDQLIQLDMAGDIYYDSTERERLIAEYEPTGRAATLELRFKRRDGLPLWVQLDAHAVKDESGRTVFFEGFVHDLSVRKQAEAAHQESEQKQRLLFNASPLGLFYYQADGRLSDGNDNFLAMFGITRAQLPGFDLRALPDAQMRRGLETALAGGIGHFEGAYLTPSGRSLPLKVDFAPIFDDARRVIGGGGIVVDLSEQQRAREMIHQQAYYDPLTSLPNRMLFTNQLTLAIKHAQMRQQRLAVFFLDLDRFKTINDTLGHAVGDRLLQGVAERLAGCLRGEDTLARFGGDEFMLMLELKPPDDEKRIAERILQTFARPWGVDGNEYHLSASLGISIYPDDGEDAPALIKNADTAANRVKEQGRGHFQRYQADMHASAFAQLALENDLRHALARGEFEVHYQPQIAVAGGPMHGVEALVRWHHPTLGLIYPMEFIPLAESTGLIVPISEWVMQTACVQHEAWHAAGLPPLRMAVNLSVRQFLQPGLADTIALILKNANMNARYLELEITESVAMQNAELAIRTLGELKRMGVMIAIDDFGTGYSSLSYLKRLPIDALKIDQSFVRDITNDPDDAAIVSAAIVMAHSLKLMVTAEGVETEAQRNFLARQQCDYIQGYLFSKPVPAAAIEAMLRGESSRAEERAARGPAAKITS
jgi:diguanylate cyclase (GGDEF)-like protein/PAS domain S-box-containing protein